jgi:hypothetical protein
MTEDWETDFSMPIRFHPPIMCHHCKQYTTTPHWVIKEIGRGTMQLAFCDADHANEYYLNKLRSGL